MLTNEPETKPGNHGGLDRPSLDAAASTLRTSRLLRRLLTALTPLVLAALMIVTPTVAVAAGTAELQIGDAVYTQTGRHELTGDAPVATSTDGAAVLADGTLVAAPMDSAEETSEEGTVTRCGSIDGNSSFTPVVRWASTGAYQEHHNSLSDNILKSAGRAIPAAIAMVSSIPGDIGQASWGMAAQITGFSTDFCPIVSMGPRVDLLAGTLGNVVVSSGLGALLIVVSVGLASWRLVAGWRQGTGALKAAARSLLVPILMGSLLVIMIAPAMSGTTKTDEVTGVYDPPAMTPGWVLTNTTQALGAVVNVPLQALSNERVTETGFDLSAGPIDGGGPGSCMATTDAWANSPSSARTDASPATEAISDLWAHAGTRYYVAYQFGSADNPIGWYSYCRVLDANAGVYANTDAPETEAIEGTWHEAFRDDYELAGTGGNLNLMDAGALPRMQVTGEDQDQIDGAAILGWMVCRPDASSDPWSLVDGAENITGEGSLFSTGESISAEDCGQWWSANTVDEIPDSMLLKPGSEGVVDTGNADLDEALKTLHSTPSVPASDGFGLMISGLAALLVFGVVSAVIMVSKIGVVVMGIFMILAIVIGMVAGTGHHLKRYALSTVGLLLVTVLAQAAFVVIAVLSKILLALGSAFFSGSVFMMAAWAALAPLLAVLLLHFGTKSLIGTSPFTLRGAKTLATKGVDPGMLAGMAALGSSGAGMLYRARAARQDRQLSSKSDGMRSSAGQAVAGGGKHDAVGAMAPAGAAASGGALASGGGIRDRSDADPGQPVGRSGRAQKQSLGSMMDSLRRGREKAGADGADGGGSGSLHEVGTAADAAAHNTAAASKHGPGAGALTGALAGVKAGAGQARSSAGRVISENRADRKVLAAQRRDRWNRMSSLEKVAHRTGQVGSAAKGVGASAWKHKKKLAVAGGAGTVVALSAGTAAPALALGTLAASGYGAVKGVGLASSHGDRSRARHMLAEQAIHGMGEGSALGQRTRRRAERRALSAHRAEQSGYASQLTGSAEPTSLSQKVLSGIGALGAPRDGALRGADAAVERRLATETQRQQDLVNERGAAQQAEALGENPDQGAQQQDAQQQGAGSTQESDTDGTPQAEQPQQVGSTSEDQVGESDPTRHVGGGAASVPDSPNPVELGGPDVGQQPDAHGFEDHPQPAMSGEGSPRIAGGPSESTLQGDGEQQGVPQPVDQPSPADPSQTPADLGGSDIRQQPDARALEDQSPPVRADQSEQRSSDLQPPDGQQPAQDDRQHPETPSQTQEDSPSDSRQMQDRSASSPSLPEQDPPPARVDPEPTPLQESPQNPGRPEAPSPQPETPQRPESPAEPTQQRPEQPAPSHTETPFDPEPSEPAALRADRPGTPRPDTGPAPTDTPAELGGGDPATREGGAR